MAAKKKTKLTDLSSIIQDKKVLGAVEEYIQEIRRSHEAELTRLFALQVQVADELPLGLMVTDADGKIGYTNKIAEKLLGRTGDDLFGYHAEEILSTKLFLADKQPQLRQIAICCKSPQGKDINLSCAVIPKSVVHLGEFAFIIIIIGELDVEELKNKLSQSNRMAGIGTLARGVAHEFNNLLGGILGYAQLAQGTDNIKDYRKCNTVIFEVGQRAQEIIGNLLSFARREPDKIESIALGHLVAEVIALIERELKKSDIDVQIDIANNCILNTDVAELQQVLLNLCINAMHAMMENNGGRLSINAQALDDNVHIMVQDTGAGISADVIEQIFDPFYTTKGSIGMGNMTGSGLGLSVCYGIVKKLGGEISVSSCVGMGTTFTITLPTNTVEELQPRMKNTTLSDFIEPEKTSVRILVVDDEAVIRNLLKDTLLTDGHEVQVETNGFAAVERARHFEPDIAIVDAQMPGLSGLEVYHELLQDHPTIKFLMITGKAGDEYKDYARKIKGLGLDVISKPFDLIQIRRILAKFIMAGRQADLAPGPSN